MSDLLAQKKKELSEKSSKKKKKSHVQKEVVRKILQNSREIFKETPSITEIPMVAPTSTQPGSQVDRDDSTQPGSLTLGP